MPLNSGSLPVSLEDTDRSPERPTAIGYFKGLGVAYLLTAILALTSIWISFGHFQYSQHADTLLQVLISLQRWTPFYWDADRYGMLFPLLAMPFRNPLTNMMAQSAMTIFTCLAASFLLVRYFFGDSRIWFVAAALQNIWLLLLTQKGQQFDWFVAQPYGTTLALGAAALLLLRKGRWLWAFVLLFLAHWVNVGAFVFLVPLVLLRFLIGKERRGLALELVMIALSIAAGFVAKAFAVAPKTHNAVLPISVWMAGWQDLLLGVRTYVVAGKYAVLWMIIPALLGLAFLLAKKLDRYAVLAAGSFTATGLAIWLFVGTESWVQTNMYSPRYTFTSLFLFTLAAAVLTVSPFQGVPLRRATQAAIAATFGIFLTAALVYGFPSRGRVQRDMDKKFGAYTQEIIDSHATLVAGDYWTAWPTVFHTNLMLYRLHDPRRVYGVGYRSGPTGELWSYQRAICAATPIHDRGAEELLMNSPWHFSHVSTLSTIDLFCEPCPQH